MYKRIALTNGQHIVLQTLTVSPGLFDQAKVWYGKAVVVLASLLAVANELSPVFDFLPGQDKHYITVGLSALAATVALLKKEQAWVNTL